MKFYRINRPAYAKDVLISIANKLPHNLIVRENELMVLFRLGEGGLEKLLKESENKDLHRPLYLSLFTKEEGSKECAHSFNYDAFDWDSVVKVEISGNTCDAWDNRTRNNYQYISVVFVTKAS